MSLAFTMFIKTFQQSSHYANVNQRVESDDASKFQSISAPKVKSKLYSVLDSCLKCVIKSSPFQSYDPHRHINKGSKDFCYISRVAKRFKLSFETNPSVYFHSIPNSSVQLILEAFKSIAKSSPLCSQCPSATGLQFFLSAIYRRPWTS